MDLDSIARFIAVIDNGNFASAARELRITPQALSSSIAKLEKSLGLVLFDRERGGVTRPTELGTTLLPHARFLIATQMRAIEELRARRDGDSGWVRFGIGESLAGSIAAEAIAELREETPDARIAIVEGYTDDLLARMQRGELDLVAGAPDRERLPREEFTQEYLYATTDVLVARRDHPLAGKEHVSLQDMQGFPWMLPYSRNDNHDVMVAAYAEESLRTPKELTFCDSATLRMEMLASADFILFISRGVFWPRLGDPASPFVVLHADKPTVKRQACLIYRADSPLNALTKRLRDKITERAVREADKKRAAGSTRKSRMARA